MTSPFSQPLAWPNQLQVGFHVSVAGGPARLFERFRERGCQAVQIFVGSPRVWKRTPFSTAQREEFRRHRHEAGNPPVVVHSGYLINLASVRSEVRAQSIELLREEFLLARSLGADYLVQHMGSHADLETGLALMIEGLNASLSDVVGDGPLVLLENTAGERNDLGARFEDLARVRKGLRFDTGVCFDTCHAFQAGYDLATAKGRSAVFYAWEKRLGREAVKVIHLNDSLNPFHKGHDRHQHIGEGYIGDEGLAAFLRHPLCQGLAVILETPQDPSGDPHLEWKNLSRLQKILGENGFVPPATMANKKAEPKISSTNEPEKNRQGTGKPGKRKPTAP